jgi:hypothetical protein
MAGNEEDSRLATPSTAPHPESGAAESQNASVDVALLRRLKDLRREKDLCRL